MKESDEMNGKFMSLHRQKEQEWNPPGLSPHATEESRHVGEPVP